MSEVEIESGLEWSIYCELFARLSANYNRPIDDRVRATFWKQIQWWPASDAIAAFENHLLSSKWFPTVAEILEARPKKHKTIEHWDREAGINWMDEEATTPTDITLEERIDSLEDGDLAAIFSGLDFNWVPESPQVKWLVNEFRRHSGGIYRTVIRDLLK